MKKLFVLIFLLAFSVSACLPAALQPQADGSTPIPENILQVTAAVLAQQTLQSMPTQTALPSNTPAVNTPSQTPSQTAIPVTATETQNPVLLTLTATLGTGTVAPGTVIPAELSTGTIAALPAGSSNTATPSGPTTPHPQFFGTLPPEIPSGLIVLNNKSETEVYISLRCETSKGNVTILEYPVKRIIDVEAPIGQYTYVAWVGGRQMTGAFSLGHEGVIKIDIFKNRITIK